MSKPGLNTFSTHWLPVGAIIAATIFALLASVSPGRDARADDCIDVQKRLIHYLATQKNASTCKAKMAASEAWDSYIRIKPEKRKAYKVEMPEADTVV